MAQHDYVIANQSGASFRADLNNALAAIVSQNSGAVEPSTTYAYQWWADTTAGQLKLRNASNSDWIVFSELDGTMLMEDGSAATPGLAFATDLDTGFFRVGTNQLGIAAGNLVHGSSSPINVFAADANDGITFYAPGTTSGVFHASNDSNALAFFRRRGTDGTVIQFHKNTTGVGSIKVTSSSTSYETSSDYRLKENVVPLTGAVDRLNQLQVHRFNFIADPDTTVDGFIAHEAQAVVPECVTGTKDKVDAQGNPVYQGIDQSKIVPLLTAALQEALTKIEILEVKVAALEGN